MVCHDVTLPCIAARAALIPHACRRYAHGHALCTGDQTGSRKMQTPGPGTWLESCHVPSRSPVYCYGSTVYCVLWIYCILCFMDQLYTVFYGSTVYCVLWIYCILCFMDLLYTVSYGSTIYCVLWIYCILCFMDLLYTVFYGSTCVLYMYYGHFFSLVPGHPGNRTVYTPVIFFKETTPLS